MQLADLNDAYYPGGLTAYLTRAKQLLLQQSAINGTNPFSEEEYTAHVPKGERLSFDGQAGGTSLDFAEMEQLGLECIEHVAVVLVAGGLGERLGYSGIKLSLECNLCSNKSYLEYYICYIQAMQHHVAQQQTGGRRNRAGAIQIPLVIMTSQDTDTATRQLLWEHDNFGLEEDQITIVVQDKVPALQDIHAGLALEENDRWTVQTKPHGHGDVHHLLHRKGLVDKWQNEGKKYVIFLQDTNALAINSIIPTLGVSRKKGFHMNSICIPRLAGEAAGAIVRLE
jgi:UDP-sugar pyrophosphorylase